MEELGTIRYSIIFPRMYNPQQGGGLIPERILEKYRIELVEVFRGITQYGATTGFWSDPTAGNITLEPRGESNYVLTIDAAKVAFPIHRIILEQILLRMCLELQQKAIHFSYHDCKSFLVQSKNESPSGKQSIHFLPGDRLFLLDKEGRIVAHSSSINEIGDEGPEDGDLIYIAPKKLVDRYGLHEIVAVGRHSQ